MTIDPQSFVIFTDGACSGNPGPGGWGSIVAMPNGRVRELGGGERATTNNRMEMMAAIEALGEVLVVGPANVVLHTDSTYLIRGITQWIWGWRSRGWKSAEGKDVANRDLWEELARQITQLKPHVVDWRHVRGHEGIPGNERCDEIAVGYSKGTFVALYNGSSDDYDVDLNALPENLPLPERKPSSGGSSGSKSSGGPASYLSYHGGVVRRHKTWAQCESRVKGQSNAKFKKAKSQQDEREILSSWGLDPKCNVVDE